MAPERFAGDDDRGQVRVEHSMRPSMVQPSDPIANTSSSTSANSPQFRRIEVARGSAYRTRSGRPSNPHPETRSPELTPAQPPGDPAQPDGGRPGHLGGSAKSQVSGSRSRTNATASMTPGPGSAAGRPEHHHRRPASASPSSPRSEQIPQRTSFSADPEIGTPRRRPATADPASNAAIRMVARSESNVPSAAGSPPKDRDAQLHLWSLPHRRELRTSFTLHKIIKLSPAEREPSRVGKVPVPERPVDPAHPPGGTRTGTRGLRSDRHARSMDG